MKGLAFNITPDVEVGFVKEPWNSPYSWKEVITIYERPDDGHVMIVYDTEERQYFKPYDIILQTADLTFCAQEYGSRLEVVL